MTEELRPCPVHGNGSVVFATSSKKYVGCEACGDGKGETWYRPVEQWNSAWCWKEIDRLRELVKAKDAGINKCLDHWALVAGPSAFERSGMRVLLEKALKD